MGLNPFDTCGRPGCGHYRGVHFPGQGCVLCSCPEFSKVKYQFKEWFRKLFQG